MSKQLDLKEKHSAILESMCKTDDQKHLRASLKELIILDKAIGETESFCHQLREFHQFVEKVCKLMFGKN